jgi:transposase InsO family protein
MNNRKYNNIRFTDHKIEQITAYLRDHINPTPFPKHLREQFNAFVLTPDNKLQLKETEQVVVPDADIPSRIKEIYDQYGLGSGADNLYAKVSRRYLNITRKQIKDFLSKNLVYQLAKAPLPSHNKRIYASDVNKIWYADLMDLNTYESKNQHYRYILTVVDSFSKFVMLARLKSKESREVVKGFEEQILPQTTGEYWGSYCKTLITDNGTEFKNEQMSEFCEQNNIKQVFGLSYSPKSNALAEATNNIIRNILRHLFIKNGNTKWCDYLPTILKSINDTAPSSTGRPRSEVFLQGEHIDSIHRANLDKKKRTNETAKLNALQVGDKVRVSLNEIETNIRKKNKQGLQKYVIARFSYEIYTITKIMKSKSKFIGDRYKIADDDGEVLSKEFFANQLQKIDPNDTTQIRNINAERINEINSVPVVDFSVRNENYTPPVTRASIIKGRPQTRGVVRIQRRGGVLDWINYF